MKRFSIWGSLMVCLTLLFTFTACEEDGTGDNANPPILTLENDGVGSFITTDTTVAPGTMLNFRLSGLSGSNEMQNVRFLEDGVLVADYATRITIDGVAASSASVLLFDAQRSSFTWDIKWVAHTDESSKIYRFELVDTEGNSSSQTIEVNTLQQYPGPLAVSLDSGSGCIFTDINNVVLGSTINLCVMAVRDGEAPLSSITVMENGNPVDISRLEMDDIPFTANPSDLLEGDENGFSRKISIVLPSTYSTTYSYSIQLANTAGTTVSTTDLNVTMEDDPIQPADVVVQTGVLLNAAGPQGQGGLDLSTGNGNINSSSPDADIKDAGIDGSLPNNQNWKQQVEPANGAILRIPNMGSDLNTPYNQVQYQSEIQASFDAGSTVSISSVNIGTELLVQANGVIYHLVCTDVTVTPDNNNDSYTFSYKY